MNSREQHKKFAQSSTIRNSEYDRLNSNATRHSNPIGQGQNLLPPETNNKKSTNNIELILRIISLFLGIGTYFLTAFIGKLIMGNKLDDSLIFLFVVLALSALSSYTFFNICKKRFM